MSSHDDDNEDDDEDNVLPPVAPDWRLTCVCHKAAEAPFTSARKAAGPKFQISLTAMRRLKHTPMNLSAFVSLNKTSARRQTTCWTRRPAAAQQLHTHANLPVFLPEKLSCFQCAFFFLHLTLMLSLHPSHSLSPLHSFALSIYHQFNFLGASHCVIYGHSHTTFQKLRVFVFVARSFSAFTLPTYCGSEPMYSSSTKNWFQTQPLLTRWNPDGPFLAGPAELRTCSRAALLRPSGAGAARRGKTEPRATTIHRNSSRQFLASIGGL